MLAALSNDEVASSKRYTGVSRKSARASAILCFCPPDKLDLYCDLMTFYDLDINLLINQPVISHF